MSSKRGNRGDVRSTRRVGAGTGMLTCPVCLDDSLSLSDVVYPFGCGHAVCDSCNTSLIGRNDLRCPMCRVPRQGVTEEAASQAAQANATPNSGMEIGIQLGSPLPGPDAENVVQLLQALSNSGLPIASNGAQLVRIGPPGHLFSPRAPGAPNRPIRIARYTIGEDGQTVESTLSFLSGGRGLMMQLAEENHPPTQGPQNAPEDLAAANPTVQAALSAFNSLDTVDVNSFRVMVRSTID